MKIKNWIFLSYARGDLGKVKDLYQRLYHAGFNPWLDRIHLLPGERWRETVPKRIREAKLVLLCLSKYSVNKTGYFWREIRMALDAAQEKPPSEFYLIPVRFEECKIPDDLQGFHCADLFEEGDWMKLVRVIQIRLKYRRKESRPVIVKNSRRIARLAIRSPRTDQIDLKHKTPASRSGTIGCGEVTRRTRIHEDRTRYYVSFDLGSESLAAYYEDVTTGRGGMVQLQFHAKTLVRSEPEYLMDENGNISPRLTTRIPLMDDRQPAVLPESHAALQFIDKTGQTLSGYDQTLFGYFYETSSTLMGKSLPSPDVLFVHGVQGIIPAVQARSLSA